MPELPDVESHRRTIHEHALGQVTRRVEVPDPALIEGTSPTGLGRSLKGRTVSEAHRQGKWLSMAFDDDGPQLVFHFRMTGELVWLTDDELSVYDALALRFEHGTLTYRTRRRLGGVTYLPAGADLSEVTGPLGPDATEVGRDELGELLGSSRGGLKSTLMDQQRIAGLGNELVDEILWRSGLDPRAKASDVGGAELTPLSEQMHAVLRRSIRAGHVPSGPTWLNAQRDSDDPRCPNCGNALERTRVAGRTTVWCATDQTAPAAR